MTERPYDLVFVGGGASGLAGAVAAARLGLKTLVLEKMDRCGHKLALTGGRKGNLTHEADPRAMAQRFDCEPSRIVPLLRRFPFSRIVAFFSNLGLRCRLDDDGCVWPERGRAGDVRDALVEAAERAGADIQTGHRVVKVEPRQQEWQVLSEAGSVKAKNVCLATGGASYPQTGSTGDGLELCRRLGLETTDWFPALASLTVQERLDHLAGTTHDTVKMELAVEGEKPRSAAGHFIFAHGFISGSAILNLSGHAARALASGREVELRVDWCPDRSRERLTGELAACRRDHPKKRLTNVLAQYVSRRLAAELAARANVDGARLITELRRSELEPVLRQLKATEFSITGTEPIERATVTGGGLKLSEVDITTCRVHKCPGLHVVAELLDTWAETGGYNLHFAWATGIAVAEAAAGKEYG